MYAPTLPAPSSTDRAGLLNERLLAVHGVQLTDANSRGCPHVNATIVTCPRSNTCTGAAPGCVASRA